MRKLEDATSLKWEQTGKLSSHLVSADGGEIATLEWAKRWSSLATGESAEGSWTFKRAGFLRPRVTVREKDSDSDYAVLHLGWRGDGSAGFTDGDTVTVKRAGIRSLEWSISDSARRKILTLKPTLGWKRSGCQVAVGDGGTSGKTVFVAILGWYVILLTAEYDSSAASTAAVLAASGA